eukprot:gnl/TRDRNA2_/TRDRNA2_159168_c1_seq1.p1 gnl/TRDRNA2_/TRDRNA2_159168_c1~~gnl/TRDRNA2_/TRDRNA2_159168_c1_seq1.p1  ORF type:complete len:440 (+),score=66.94 gnl/TRDRNA2_/TRDRNA2_159168_c1_seq1:1-1320(+)
MLPRQLCLLVAVTCMVHISMRFFVNLETPSDVSQGDHRRLQDGGIDAGDESESEAVESTSQTSQLTQMDAAAFWAAQVSPIDDLVGYMNSVVTFHLGIFLVICLQRWWSMRSAHYHGLLKSANVLMSTLAMVLYEDKYTPARQRCARYSILSHRLLFLCARGRAEWPDVKPELLNLRKQGLLADDLEVEALLRCLETVEESERACGFEIRPQSGCCCWRQMANLLFPGNRRTPHLEGQTLFNLAELPWLWACREIHELYYHGAMVPAMMAKLHRSCLDASTAIHQVQMQMSTQLPFPYAHLVTILVHGASFAITIKCGVKTAISDSVMAVICEIFFDLVLICVYLGLLALTAVIADPFGDDAIDFPESFLEQEVLMSLSSNNDRRRAPTLINHFVGHHHHPPEDTSPDAEASSRPAPSPPSEAPAEALRASLEDDGKRV